MTSRISAITLVVPDYDTAISFYVEKLGFSLIADEPQGDKRWVVVTPDGGGAQIVLARADGPDQELAVGNQTGGRVSFFLQTDDFGGKHAAMLAAGVVFEEDPRTEHYGTVAVWRDPFGNRWDLLQPRTQGP